MLLKGDQLADGTTVAAVHLSEGMVYADLDDGRQLVLPDWYLLSVYRPDSEKSKVKSPDSHH